ncbi:YjdF family protein [Lactobacillus sp. ESL0785]|uniref:YjdF family protein n=1 Tax=Lactobacillus sp. ESL0785 TaxID=2983232 RepID=UPI0023F7B4DA|nr:YjdF family protein [Lactobacillus sp. ESL0785]WEV71442.1 YjdF family protein [Lactobacillus sp. ESL0785]
MSTIYSSLSIVFEPPFYKAVFERRDHDHYEVAQVNLGTSEPKTTMLYSLILNHWQELHFFQQADLTRPHLVNHLNPKRRQRLAKKAIKKGVSTKAQLALQKQFEQNKLTKKVNQRKYKTQLAEAKFKLRKEKKRKKHQGH